MMVLAYIGASIVFGWVVTMWLGYNLPWHPEEFYSHTEETQKYLFCRKRSDTVNFGFFETIEEAHKKLVGDGDVFQIQNASITVKYSKNE